MDRLQDSLKAAIRAHASTFPINAFELLTAWWEIEKTEDVEAKEFKAEDRQVNAIKYCAQVSGHINSDGEIIVADPFDKSKDLVLPCPYCRPAANREARDRHNGKYGTLSASDALRLAETFVPPKKPDRLTVPETALEMISILRNEVGREMLADPNNKAARKAWERLARAGRYLYEQGDR